jgi:hypothetical protein
MFPRYSLLRAGGQRARAAGFGRGVLERAEETLAHHRDQACGVEAVFGGPMLVVCGCIGR